MEFDYAKLLRESGTADRRRLYGEAYTEVYKFKTFPGDKPEERTAGTTKDLVDLLACVVDEEDSVLEIGCGRGYTCLMLAPHVRSIVGTDVSETALVEAAEVLSQYNRKNAEVRSAPAFDLVDKFDGEQFDSAISIEVVEHLHPEDAEEHFRQVFQLLKPKGKYVIVMPNRLDGPHDITKNEYPELSKAIGFHLNESTYSEMTAAMRKVGFCKFRSFHPLRFRDSGVKAFYLPYQFNVLCEFIYQSIPRNVHVQMLENLIKIRLVAHRP